jgi:hypothetical protein
MSPLARQMASLRLRTPEGGTVDMADFRHRCPVVVAFLEAGCEPCRTWLAELLAECARREALAALVVVRDEGELPGWPAGIYSGQVESGDRERWLGADARLGVFVADRYGELYAQWTAPDHDGLPPASAVISRLEQAELACEECGISHWPPSWSAP